MQQMSVVFLTLALLVLLSAPPNFQMLRMSREIVLWLLEFPVPSELQGFQQCSRIICLLSVQQAQHLLNGNALALLTSISPQRAAADLACARKPLSEGFFLFEGSMHFFHFLNFQKEKMFAAELVSQLVKEVPPDLMQKRRKSLSVNKVTRLLEKTYALVAKFQTENKMGFFRRSVFANAFRWELKNQNYPEDFATLATEGLVVALMKKNSPRNTD